MSNTEDAAPAFTKLKDLEKLALGKQRMIWRVFGNPHELGKRILEHDMKKSPTREAWALVQRAMRPLPSRKGDYFPTLLIAFKKLSEATQALLDVDPAALTVRKPESLGEATWTETREDTASEKFNEFLVHNDVNPERTHGQRVWAHAQKYPEPYYVLALEDNMFKLAAKETFVNWARIDIEDYRDKYADLAAMKREYEIKKRNIIRLEIICWIRKYFLRDLLDIMDGDYRKVIDVMNKKKIDRILDIEATQLRALKDMVNHLQVARYPGWAKTLEPYGYVCNERGQMMPSELIFLIKWVLCIVEHKMTCTNDFNKKEQSALVKFCQGFLQRRQVVRTLDQTALAERQSKLSRGLQKVMLGNKLTGKGKKDRDSS